MEKIDKYLNRDYYSVEMIGGRKVVIFHGYFYTEGYEIEKAKPYRAVDYSGAYIPLEDLLKEDKSVVEDYLANCKQSMTDLSEAETYEAMKHYFGINIDGRMVTGPGKPLPFAELSMDTPCGCYVDYKKAPKKALKKEGDRFRLSGDIHLEDYNCRVDTTGEVLMDQKEGETKLLCILDYIDGDRNVTAYVDVKDMLVA